MERFTGILGIVLILGVAYLFSNNRKAINFRLVFSGLALQLTLAVLILRVPPVKTFFQFLGRGMEKIEAFAREGASFVYGNIAAYDKNGIVQNFRMPGSFVFAFSIPATIILVCVVVNIFYHYGIMQRVVMLIARGVHFIMGASGSETLSNVASAFVGQVEAQVMIRPYLAGMTRSELLTSMSGSMACIAGGILVIYVNMGVPAEYLIAASLMAAPAAIVISKIVYPETEVSQTKGKVSIEVKTGFSNIIDAVSHGASDGMKISINVIAMLVGFIALIALINYVLGKINYWCGSPLPDLSLNLIFSYIFAPFAFCMGVPKEEVFKVAGLMGQKLSINEFVAYLNLTAIKSTLSPKALVIASFALCGFANFSSVGIQIGGIGELAPERRTDLAQLGMRALLCGTLASYLSATIAGILF